MVRTPILQRIAALIDVQSPGCWLWTGSVGKWGYGKINVYQGGKWRTRTPHRVLYEILVGEVKPGYELDHLCRRPHCVNPDHLEPVTGRTNGLRGYGPCAQNARKRYCIRGHAFAGENIYIDRYGTRWCRACAVIRSRTYQVKRKKGPL